MFCPDNEKKPSDFIRFLKEKLDEVKKLISKKELPKKELPKYVEDYFSQINFEIEMSKGNINKEQILINNDDVAYFTKKLEKQLEVSVKRYLVMKIDDDDEDEN
jgi:hypothetical protein